MLETSLILAFNEARREDRDLFVNDMNLAIKAINVFIEYIQEKLLDCPTAQDNYGICIYSWKHDDCRILMNILFELTLEERYKDIWR